MTNSFRHRLLAFASRTCLVSMTLLAAGSVGAQAPDAAAHKAWMNDASDAQDDYRFAITDKDQKAAAEALGKT